MNGFEIRPLSEDDLSALCRMEAVCFTDPWSEEGFRSSFRTPDGLHIAAVTEDGTLCGYLIGSCVFGEAEILNLAVDPSHRRGGIAHAMMTVFLTESAARGAENVFLDVRESNTPARNLYAGLGFQETGRRKNYYRFPKEDAIEMQRTLC